MITPEARVAFLKAVRALELEHGLFLESSEWLDVVQYLPDSNSGVFSAMGLQKEAARLDAESLKPSHENA